MSQRGCPARHCCLLQEGTPGRAAAGTSGPPAPSPSPPHRAPFLSTSQSRWKPWICQKWGLFVGLGFATEKARKFPSPPAEEGLAERVAPGMLCGHGVNSAPDPFPIESKRKFRRNQFSLNFSPLCHKAESVSLTLIKHKSPATLPTSPSVFLRI